MNETERADEPRPDENAAGPPAAVEWMMQQAESQLPLALPAARSDLLAASADLPDSTPAVPDAVPPARRRRVDDALRGNPRLTAGLPAAAADALLALGLDMARAIVDDTAGLDDAAAEDVLQPRVRAVRRLMMTAAETAGTDVDEDDVAGWAYQASVALGNHFRPADAAAESALAGTWRDAVDLPADRIAALRRFIEAHTCR